MNNYEIRLVHPEWGETSSLTAQGNNAYHALENAVGYGTNGSQDVVMTAFVRNTMTGFTAKIEFMHT